MIPRALRPRLNIRRQLLPGHQRQIAPITRYPSRGPHLYASSRQNPKRNLRSSYNSGLVYILVACGGVVLIRQYFWPSGTAQYTPAVEAAPLTSSTLPSESPFYTDMPLPQGHLGNLTPEQEEKLREFWSRTLKTFGVEDPNVVPDGKLHLPPETGKDSDSITSTKEKRKKSRLSIFGRRDHSLDGPGSPGSPTRGSGRQTDEEDKYGQMKEFQQIISTQTPESLRATFWSMVKADHPDALLLRFLRARKWDVDRALVMMISTMSWRSKDIHLDDDLVRTGEGGALEDCASADKSVSQEGKDFLEQLRLGKSFLHGTDKEGRPLCFVRARLHHGGDQSERSMERYTVYVIETARLVLRTPVETACIIFDMTNFTMANMDYAPVKFMIKIFEANYPESLGAVLVHKAPWLFNAIWKIIKGWLDPVVASKVHFTSDLQDLEKYIAKSQIIKELGGDEDWEYKYVEPVPGENALMKEEAPRLKLEEERKKDVLEYQKKTFEWISSGGNVEVKEERDRLADALNHNYWLLDPYIRARTLYDRVGMIGKGGKINFYPPKDEVNGEVAAAAAAPAQAADTPPPVSAPQDDDVD